MRVRVEDIEEEEAEEMMDGFKKMYPSMVDDWIADNTNVVIDPDYYRVTLVRNGETND